MQYCERCKVTIVNPSGRCPLCGGQLEGEPEPDSRMFPDCTREYSVIDRGFRVFTFICIALVLISLAVNFVFPTEIFWAGFVTAAIACMWVLSAVALQKRRNLLKNTLYQMILLCGVFVLWDFLTGYKGWSLDYAVPIVILAAFPILTVMVRLLKSPVSYYMIYYILACGIGILPMIFLAAGLVKMRIPSVLCGTVSVLILAGFIIFQSRNFWEEIRKKMHL